MGASCPEKEHGTPFGEGAIDEPKRIVLLQGPVGPFFDCLHSFLKQKHCVVWRFCFHSGDRFFIEKNKPVHFKGNLGQWAHEFEVFLQEKNPHCIVLFGSERPAHKIARELAKLYGISLLSLEEGYIRPGFVTVESSGNNASSPLCGQLPEESFNPEMVKDCIHNVIDYKSFNRMGLYATAYYSIRTLLSISVSRELFHRRFFPPWELFCWLRNGYRKVFHRGGDNPIILRLLEHFPKKYFLVPLQVAADSNLQLAAMGWDSPRLIHSSIASFAQAAPSDTRLVFKVHPLERGHNRYEQFIQETAMSHGVMDRVDLIDTGSMGLLTHHSAGMITINSTSGLSAIHHGVPLLVIGKAVYANSRLAMCGNGKPEFDKFWRYHEHYGPVESVNFRHRYLDWLRYRALVKGDYYHPDGMQLACEGIWDKVCMLDKSSVVPWLSRLSDEPGKESEEAHMLSNPEYTHSSDNEPCGVRSVSL